jgi:hypothetical protein
MTIEELSYLAKLEQDKDLSHLNLSIIKEMSVWEFFLVKIGIHSWRNYLFV